MILNEQPQSIKLSTHRTNGDSVNEDRQSNNQKHTESQNFLSDLSQREQLEDPKELSFNKEGFHKEENNYKESVFSKQKNPTDKNVKFKTDETDMNINMNELELKINRQFHENVLRTDQIDNLKCLTEPNDMNELEQKSNRQFQENVLRTDNIDNLKCFAEPNDVNQLEQKINRQFQENLLRTDKIDNLKCLTEPNDVNQLEQKINSQFHENLHRTDKIDNLKCFTEPNDVNQIEKKITRQFQENLLRTDKNDNLKCLTEPNEQMEEKIVQFNRNSDEKKKKISTKTIRVKKPLDLKEIQNKIQEEENKKNEKQSGKLGNFSTDIKTILGKVQKTIEKVEEEKMNEKKPNIKREIQKEQNNKDRKNNSHTPKANQTKTNATASIYPSILENPQKNYFDSNKNYNKISCDSDKNLKIFSIDSEKKLKKVSIDSNNNPKQLFSVDSDKTPKNLDSEKAKEKNDNLNKKNIMEEIVKKYEKCNDDTNSEAIKMNDKFKDLFEKDQKFYKDEQIENYKQLNFIPENKKIREKTLQNQPEKQETSIQYTNKTAEKNQNNIENRFQSDLNDFHENSLPHQEKKTNNTNFDNDRKTTEKKQLKFYNVSKETDRDSSKDFKNLNLNENNQNNLQSLIQKNPQNLKNSSVLNQINDLDKDIDFKIKHLQENW